MAEPARPATMRPESTADSSRTIDRATSEPTKLSALKRFSTENVWRASTMPVKSAVRNTTGTESTPTFTICRNSSRKS